MDGQNALMELIFFAGLALWIFTVALLSFFAIKPRATRTKVLSLLIPASIAVVCLIAFLKFRSSELGSMFFAFPVLIGLTWSVFVCLALAIPHFISIFVSQYRSLYGTFALLLLLTPLSLAARSYLDHRARMNEISQIKHEAEPDIEKCCGGNAESCRKTAEVFDRAFELGLVRSHETDLRNKYRGKACRFGTKSDCELFANSVGSSYKDYKSDRLYKEKCDTRDLYSEPRPRDDFAGG
jgi:hypothetical protein